MNKTIYLAFSLLILVPGLLHAEFTDTRPATNLNYIPTADGVQQPAIDPLQQPSNQFDGSLSLEDALRYALEANQGIEIAAYYPRQAEQDFKRLSSVYDPAFFTSGSVSEVDRPIQSQLDTGSLLDDKLTEDRWLARMGVKTLLPSGANFSLFQELDYLESSSTLIAPNPQSTSRFTLQLSQPLLKGFGDLENRTAIKRARINVRILNEDYRQTVMDIVANVGLTYWQLVFDQQMLKIAERYIAQTEELYLRENNRLKQGISKELDVNRVLANLDSRRSEFILLQKQVNSTANQLLMLLNAPPIFEPSSLLPTDVLTYTRLRIDRDNAEMVAFNQRPELERLRGELETVELNKKFARWEKLPALDLQASYSKNALDENKWTARSEVYESPRESWSVGLNFEVPIGNRAANALYRSVEFEYRRKLAELRQMETRIRFEVSQSVFDLNSAQDEVASAKEAVLTAQKVLDGEWTLFDLSRSDSSDLLQAQSQLDVAERKVAQSLAEFNRAKIVLARATGALLKDFGISIE